MLFNSHIFIFAFLPLTLLVFWAFCQLKAPRTAMGFLIFASLFFYGWWNPTYLLLILGSILTNYQLGRVLGHTHTANNRRKGMLTLGIVFNLGLLIYFKYASFIADIFPLPIWTHLHVETIILPLAISFFTFQQIAYLVDTYRDQQPATSLLHYTLFVTFFPQLIAGPIVHHREIFPQLTSKSLFRFQPQNIEIGLTIFAIGLFKKVAIADNIATYATPVFDAATRDVSLTFFAAWGGSIAYAFQIYFDFSGYSDMAIGLARLFGITLPINFNSPYKATNIIEFWRCWHMTLSRFLRDYLYIPLGGNRKGPTRRYINLLLTMLLGGLWHGASWTFVVWGGLHGIYLIITHAWQAVCNRISPTPSSYSAWKQWLSRTMTFVAVVIAWVFFRAPNFDSALNILKGMAGLQGVVLHSKYLAHLDMLGLQWAGTFAQTLGLQFGNPAYFYGLNQLFALAFLLFVVWFLPNTQQLMSQYLAEDHTVPPKPTSILMGIRWQPTKIHATICALITACAVLQLNKISEFLYFQF